MGFSLKHLLAVMIVAAMGLTAMINAAVAPARELANLATFLIFVLVGYGVWASQGAQRAFGLGFCAWGSLYFVLFKWMPHKIPIGTDTLLDTVRGLLASSITFRTDPFGNVTEEWRILDEGVRSIGHCLFALLLGLFGGWVTVYFYRKRQRMLKEQRGHSG